MAKKLKLVQNAACRVILLSGKRDSTDKMHLDLKLLRLKDRRNMHLQHINHKNIHAKGSLSKHLLRRNMIRVQRMRYVNENTLYERRLKTCEGRCAYSFRGPVSWNRLEVELREVESFNQFKSLLSKKINQAFDNHPT